MALKFNAYQETFLNKITKAFHPEYIKKAEDEVAGLPGILQRVENWSRKPSNGWLFLGCTIAVGIALFNLAPFYLVPVALSLAVTGAGMSIVNNIRSSAVHKIADKAFLEDMANGSLIDRQLAMRPHDAVEAQIGQGLKDLFNTVGRREVFISFEKGPALIRQELKQTLIEAKKKENAL